KRKYYYDRSTKPRPVIPIGSSVLVQDPISKQWNSSARVIGRPNHRRYHLHFPSGRVLWRNTKFLRDIPDNLNPSTLEPVLEEGEHERRKSSRLTKPPNRYCS
ncbi:hypothetical protein TCAL_13370, partial [Tigriopus californicus]